MIPVRWILLPAALAGGLDALASDGLVEATAHAVNQRCGACHREADDIPVPPAPDLKGAGARYDRGWLRAFINHHKDPTPTPANTRPTKSSSPDLLAKLPKADRAPTADALTHFLLSQWRNAPKANGYRQIASAKRGLETWRRIGCAACHGPEPPDLSGKWDLLHLMAFLRQPDTVHPDGRMPDLMLADHEAADLAVLLTRFPSSNLRDVKPPGKPAFDADLAAKGKELFQSVGCANCHDLGLRPRRFGPPMAELHREHTRALRLGACTVAVYPDHSPRHIDLGPTYLANRHRIERQRLGCLACHQQPASNPTSGDQRLPQFTGDDSLAQAGRIPPPLDDASAKLQPDWYRRIVDTPEARLRPYIDTRMPVYKGHGAKLIAHLAPSEPDPKPPAGDAEAGRRLAGVGGMNCVTCHRIGEWPSLGIPGLDLASTPQRLRYAWFRQYLLDPAAYRPGTLMPALWPDGRSTQPDILGGDTDRQIAALWAYFENPEQPPPGAKPPGKAFEIAPTNAPVVLRTFDKHAGTHALLIGFPSGHNLSFDTRSCRVRALWKGRFIDGYSTWFDRFATPAEPLENEVVVLARDPFATEGHAARMRKHEVVGGTVQITYEANGETVVLGLRGMEDHLRVSVSHRVRVPENGPLRVKPIPGDGHYEVRW